MYGGVWSVEQNLDDLYPSKSTPEVIVANSSVTAAIEVKRLAGDSVFQAYMESVQSLERYLAPSCGGYYMLKPPSGLQLPMDLRLRKHVREEIERVAPTLAVGESGPIRVPRQGLISLSSEFGPSYISCTHLGPYSDLLRPLLDLIPTGRFFLVDEGLEHSFVTDEGREEFYQAVVTACWIRLEGKRAPLTWCEEWKLTKLGNDESGVYVMAVTKATDMNESVTECVARMIKQGQEKFKKRWADHHILVLQTSVGVPARLVSAVMAGFEPEDLKEVDLILLVDKDRIVQCYPPTSAN